MYIELTKNEMISDLVADEYANWGYDEAELIVDWLEEYELAIDEPVSFDRVAIRCEFSAMPIEDLEQAYDHLFEPGEVTGWDLETWADALSDYTSVLGITSDCVVFAQF